MRCPKCGYVGYQEVARCRNCGYDFSLSDDGAADLALPLRTDDPAGPLADFVLAVDAAGAAVPPEAGSPGAPELPGALADAPAATLGSAPPTPRDDDDARAGAAPDGEWLPLFGTAEPDDQPLVRGSLTPRAPLAVRRTTTDLQRVRPRAGRTSPRRTEPLPGLSAPGQERPSAGGATDETDARRLEEDGEPAGAVARAAAALLDLALLAAIDTAVLYFTLGIAGLRLEQWGVIPKGPFLAFLILLDCGYLVAFTVAGGQTLGKMAAGLRVVGVSGPLDLGRAVARAAGCLATIATAGLGYLPALVAGDGRAIHDRLAGTRVVRQP